MRCGPARLRRGPRSQRPGTRVAAADAAEHQHTHGTAPARGGVRTCGHSAGVARCVATTPADTWHACIARAAQQEHSGLAAPPGWVPHLNKLRCAQIALCLLASRRARVRGDTQPGSSPESASTGGEQALGQPAPVGSTPAPSRSRSPPASGSTYSPPSARSTPSSSSVLRASSPRMVTASASRASSAAAPAAPPLAASCARRASRPAAGPYPNP